MKMIFAEFRNLDWAPEITACLSCGHSCPKLWETDRAALDCQTDGLSLLNIRIGVYSCMICGHYFRVQPPFLSPKATYTNRVINAAVSSVVEDGMPISRVAHRLMRDFGISPSEGAIRKWLSKAGFDLEGDTVIDLHAIQEFSGVLCIDEGYSGKLSLLLATDPSGDSVIAYALHEGSFSQADVDKFLTELKNAGIEPEQVVTDQSQLYPAIVKKIWPKVQHQLCLFHVSQNFVRAARKAFNSLKNTFPKPPKGHAAGKRRKSDQASAAIALQKAGVSIKEIARRLGVSRNTVKKWSRDPAFVATRYGIDTTLVSKNALADYELQPITPASIDPPSPWQDWDQVRNVSTAFKKVSFAIVARESEKLDTSEHWKTILESPVGQLAESLRNTVCQWYDLWYEDDGARRTQKSELFTRWDAMRKASIPAELQPLKSFQSRMTDQLFEHVAVFTQDLKFEATNNSSERQMRLFKKVQKHHYRLRAKASFAKIYTLRQRTLRSPIKHNEMEQHDLFRARSVIDDQC